MVAVFPTPTFASTYRPVAVETITVSEPIKPDKVPGVTIPLVAEAS